MLRFLATGDLHVHPYQQFAYTRSDGMNSRLYNCLRVFPFMRKEALRRKIDKILINGDLLHESDWIKTETYDAVYRELEKNHDEGIETVINLGQHDVHAVSGGRILHALRAFCKVARIVEKPKLVWDHLQIVPWIESAETLKKTISLLPGNKNTCLCLHCGVQGAKTGPNDFVVPNSLKLRDIRYKAFALVLLSDYHTRQKLATNVQYLGSPIQHSFGEIHRPCIWDISVGGGSVRPRMEKIFTSFPQFRRVRAENENQLLKATRGFKGDYVRITTGSGLEERRIKRIAERIGFQYILKHETEEQVQMKDSRSFDINEVMKDYVQQVPKSDRRRLLQLGGKLYQGESV